MRFRSQWGDYEILLLSWGGLPGWVAVTIPDKSLSIWDDTFSWCETHESNSEFCISSNGVWWFRREEDAIMFTLKWGAHD